MAKTISGTHSTNPRRDGQAEWAWINTGMVDPSKVVTNPSTNRARRSLTSLMWRTLLPLHQTSHHQSLMRVHGNGMTCWKTFITRIVQTVSKWTQWHLLLWVPYKFFLCVYVRNWKHDLLHGFQLWTQQTFGANHFMVFDSLSIFPLVLKIFYGFTDRFNHGKR